MTWAVGGITCSTSLSGEDCHKGIDMRTIFQIAVCIFLLVELFGAVQARLGVGVRHWLWAGLVIGAAVIVSHKTFFRKPMQFLYLTTLITLIYSVCGYDYNAWTFVLSQFTVVLASLLIIYVPMDSCHIGGSVVKWSVLFSLTIIVVTAIITIIRGGADADIVRDAVINAYSDKIQDAMEGMSVRRSGVASYGLIHGVTMIIPVLIGQIKSNRSMRIRSFFLLSLILIYGMLIRAYFGTPIIVGTSLIILSVLVTRRLEYNVLIILSFCFVAFAFTQFDMLEKILTNIQPSFEGTAIYAKIDDIIYSLQINAASGQLEGRQVLYKQSWDAFLANPLMGSSDQNLLGGHAYFRDILGYYGLLGFLPLMAAIFVACRDVFRRIKPSMRSYYLISVISYIVMGCFKNYAGSELVLMFYMLVPAICLMEQFPVSAGKKCLVGLEPSRFTNRS